jgi:diacylglycerol kinase family enzyme
MTLPVDAGHAVIDGRDHLFVAHLVARRSWWRGEIVAVMNAQFIGRYDVAPRSHPNDGRLDVVHVDAAMSVRARWQARRRLPSGTYVPHPQISQRRVEEWSTTLMPPLDVWLDGVRVAHRARQVSVRCVPDAFSVVV